uniref:Uncharacterized protein isoform X2 n=1 Tax=Nicotiana tabacum TaxID=4097 RepID=A0A1S4AX48_TOBAC|nr:uncharacterized protein LOC104118774 isoform X2 [Nicotiana tomentosiformis]XP_016481259.1 PREDICTED: uncharacterized protein LOC107802303 isoform X2 [Nicotiana tabacum]
MDDSALAAAIRAIFAKNNATVPVAGQDGTRPSAGNFKTTAAHADLPDKPAYLSAHFSANVHHAASSTAGVTKATDTAKTTVDLIPTGVQDEGKELEGVAALVSAAGTKVKAVFEQAKQHKKPAADQAKDRAWTVVDRSPSKKTLQLLKIRL